MGTQERAIDISDKLIKKLVGEVEPIQGLDTIEQVMFAEKALRLSAKRFRKQYFGLIHYAEKYEWLISVIISGIVSVTTTVIVIRCFL